MLGGVRELVRSELGPVDGSLEAAAISPFVHTQKLMIISTLNAYYASLPGMACAQSP